MNKHTPGPWIIIPGGDEWSSGRIATIEQKPETMVETSYWTVAEVNYRRDEHLANAKLIAAAPDLLEALEDLKSNLILSDVDLDYIESHFRPWLNKAESAIAKARDYLFSPMPSIENSMSEWIKCGDKLPLDDAFVLCSGIGQGCRDVFIGYRDFHGNWLEYNNGDYIDGGYGDDYPANVTHWQPLPAPPAE